MKSGYACRIVTRMPLVKPGYAKHVFDNFEASKRFFDELAPQEDQLFRAKLCLYKIYGHQFGLAA